MMEKTAAERSKFLRDWISKNGTTEKLERLLHGLEYKNELHVDLIPDEIFHDLIKSNVSAFPMDEVPRYQEAFPDYCWETLAGGGAALFNA